MPSTSLSLPTVVIDSAAIVSTVNVNVPPLTPEFLIKLTNEIARSSCMHRMYV